MNETIKEVFINNAATLIVAFITFLIGVCAFVLSIRADVNTAELQVQALQQSVSSLTPLIPEMAAIQQLSKDTNDKVNLLYSRAK